MIYFRLSCAGLSMMFLFIASFVSCMIDGLLFCLPWRKTLFFLQIDLYYFHCLYAFKNPCFLLASVPVLYYSSTT